MPRVTTVLLIAAIVSAGCSAASTAEQGVAEHAIPTDAAQARVELDSMWAGFVRAMKAGDTAALARFYTDSAMFAETGFPTVRGRAAILAATAEVFACCRYLESRLEPEVTEFSGDRAFQFGTYRDVIEQAGKPPQVFSGRVAAVLQRDTTRAWRVSRVMVIRDSSSAPPAGGR